MTDGNMATFDNSHKGSWARIRSDCCYIAVQIGWLTSGAQQSDRSGLASRSPLSSSGILDTTSPSLIAHRHPKHTLRMCGYMCTQCSPAFGDARSAVAPTSFQITMEHTCRHMSKLSGSRGSFQASQIYIVRPRSIKCFKK